MSDQSENCVIRYLRRLWKFWVPDLPSLLWLVMGAMAVLFFQTLIHEGSHVIAHKLQGHEITEFKPFPHDGRWGSMDAIDSATGQRPADEASIATPQFVDIGLLLFLSLFLWLMPYLWQMRNRNVRLLFRLWYLALCIDLLVNTMGELFKGNNPGNDWNRYQQVKKYSDGTMGAFSFLIFLIPFSHFFWVYMCRWHQDPPEASGFLEDFRGGFWAYRWAALVFGVLSLAAVIISMVAFIGNSAQYRGDALFQVFFWLQCAFCVWYWIYFGLTFRYART